MDDPKEAKLTDSNSDCPRTRDAFIEWFTTDGEIDAGILKLLDDAEYPDYPHLWNKILELGFSTQPSTNMWITRAGYCYSVRYACHARFAEFIGFKESQLEEAGWIKLSGIGVPRAYGIMGVTEKQAKLILDQGAKISDTLMEAS